MPIAQGLRKLVGYKKETTWGVLAGPTGGKLLRRVTSNFNLSKETYESAEIRSDYQVSDFRHGVRSVEGSLSGELSPGSYSDFFAAALGRDFTVGVNSGALSLNLNGAAGTITRAAGSWLTAGFKIGDVVRATGFATPANNNRNLLITQLTATVLTYVVLDGGAPLTTEATATNVTITVHGRKTFTPLTGHTDDSFTFEEFYPDVPTSEVSTGNKVNTIGLQLPASGLTTLDIGFMGKDVDQVGSTQYFTTPAALSTSGIFAAVNGALLVNGVRVALITGLSININRNLTMDPVVGSNVVPDIFEGRVIIEGEFTAYFQDATFRTLFRDEVEASLVVALTTSNAPNADFVSIALPRIKVNSDTKNDGEIGIQSTHSFRALLNSAGGAGTATEATTLSIQDSLAT